MTAVTGDQQESNSFRHDTTRRMWLKKLLEVPSGGYHCYLTSVVQKAVEKLELEKQTSEYRKSFFPDSKGTQPWTRELHGQLAYSKSSSYTTKQRENLLLLLILVTEAVTLWHGYEKRAATRGGVSVLSRARCKDAANAERSDDADKISTQQPSLLPNKACLGSSHDPATSAAHIPMPEGILRARYFYSTAKYRFRKSLLHDSKHGFDKFVLYVPKTEIVTSVDEPGHDVGNLESKYVYELRSCNSYTGIAEELLNLRLPTSYPLLVLTKEIAGRQIVNRWFCQLPVDSPQRQGVESHERAIAVVKQAARILTEGLSANDGHATVLCALRRTSEALKKALRPSDYYQSLDVVLQGWAEIVRSALGLSRN